MFKNKYNKNNNYIGCDTWHYEITNHFYKSCSGVNYTAYVHDNLYEILYKEKYFLAMLMLKLCFDFIFLILGLIRSVRNFQLYAVPLVLILTCILIVTTPYYLRKVYQKR